MNVRLTIIGVMTVLILMSAGFGAAVYKSKTEEVSPLYKIRTVQSIKDEVGNLRASYLGDRIFIWSLVRFLIEKRKDITQEFSTSCSICKTVGCRISLPLETISTVAVTTHYCTCQCKKPLSDTNSLNSVVIAPSYCIKCPTHHIGCK